MAMFVFSLAGWLRKIYDTPIENIQRSFYIIFLSLFILTSLESSTTNYHPSFLQPYLENEHQTIVEISIYFL